MKTNCVQLIGYVGDHLKKTIGVNGNLRIGIRVATHYQKAAKADNAEYYTVWHNVVAWENNAEYASSHFVKGSRILVEGYIHYATFAKGWNHV